MLPHPAFLAPLPVSPLAARAPPSRLSRPVSVGRRRIAAAARFVPTASSSSSSSSPSSSSSSSCDPPPPCRPLLANLRKVVRASALSTAFLLTSFLPNAATQSAQPRFTSFSPTPASIAAPSSSSAGAPSATTSSSSDVEAAAMTLGAVTLGGLAMRVILTRVRNDDAAAEKLAAECKRLEQEEKQRSLRVQRNKLESLDPQDTSTDPTQPFSNTSNNSPAASSSSAPSNTSSESDLMSELRKRVEDLDAAAKNNPSPDADGSSRNDDMRHNPIPDRGTGSALLERPGDADNSDPPIADPRTEGPPDEEAELDNLANQDQQEMLKRMWNLSPPDKE